MKSQGPDAMRMVMTAFVFGIPETKMRCISPHVGGGRLRPAAGRGAVPRRHVLLRPAELHVPVRHARRGRRGRRRDRGGEAQALRRRRRRRQGDQPADRRRPGTGRHRAGGRPGVLGGSGLRRERPAPHLEPDGVRGSESRRLPADRARPDGDADRREPARGEGGRRDRHDRLDPGGRERGGGRARAASDPARRHAADAGARLARDASGERLRGAAMYTQRPAEFEYHRPTTLDEAIGLLEEHEDARPLAGGHSLLPLMKLRFSEPRTIVDLGRIPDLDGIDEDGDMLRIGALARHASVTASELVRSKCRVVAATAEGIGDRQVRNRGTIGGSLAHADPGADYPTVIKALAATIVATGPGGEREIAADDFFTGVFTTSLEQGELVTSVRVPVVGPGTGAAYEKHRNPASGYAVVGVAALVQVQGGKCTAARLVVGGVTGTPEHATAAAEAVIGIAPVDEAAIAAAAGKVPEALGGAVGDTYASAEYRVHLAQVLAKRAITAAFDAAKG